MRKSRTKCDSPATQTAATTTRRRFQKKSANKVDQTTIIRSESDQSSKKPCGGYSGSPPVHASATQHRSGRKTAVNTAPVGARGTQPLMARPAARCAAYIASAPLRRFGMDKNQNQCWNDDHP